MTTELTIRETGEIVTISDRARRYIRKSRADSTLRAYGAAWREFENFAKGRDELPLPATPTTVVEYLTALADAGAKVSTIGVKLAAIAWKHRTAEVADPTVFEIVKGLMNGIRRDLGIAPNKKEPATLAEVQAMLKTLPDNLKGTRDKVILLMGFAGAFRRSELVALDVADVRKSKGKLTITIRKSKTDQEGRGMIKTIPQIDDVSICPVRALQDWLDGADIKSGAIFRRVDRHGYVHGRLTSQSVALIIKRAACEAGLDWRGFSGHSLRSGFITNSLDAGQSDSDILQQTGQKSDKTMRDYRKNTGAGAIRVVKAIFEQVTVTPHET